MEQALGWGKALPLGCHLVTLLVLLGQKCALMEQVAHQTIVMQFILELAKSLKVDPRACFRQFFTKIKVGALSSWGKVGGVLGEPAYLSLGEGKHMSTGGQASMMRTLYIRRGLSHGGGENVLASRQILKEGEEQSQGHLQVSYLEHLEEQSSVC